MEFEGLNVIDMKKNLRFVWWGKESVDIFFMKESVDIFFMKESVDISKSTVRSKRLLLFQMYIFLLRADDFLK